MVALARLLAAGRGVVTVRCNCTPPLRSVSSVALARRLAAGLGVVTVRCNCTPPLRSGVATAGGGVL